MSNLPAQVLLAGNDLFTDYKGALTEQYVLQQLKSVKNLSIYYWSADNSQGEIDFLLQHEADIIPVEVKAEENLKANSVEKQNQDFLITPPTCSTEIIKEYRIFAAEPRMADRSRLPGQLESAEWTTGAGRAADWSCPSTSIFILNTK